MPRQVTPRTMRTQIVLQSKTETVNGLGEKVATWADDGGPRYAEATPTRARDQFTAGKEQLPCDVVFRIRYRTGISATTHRVMWRSEPYELSGEPIDVDGMRTTLELMAIKGVRDGR